MPRTAPKPAPSRTVQASYRVAPVAKAAPTSTVLDYDCPVPDEKPAPYRTVPAVKPATHRAVPAANAASSRTVPDYYCPVPDEKPAGHRAVPAAEPAPSRTDPAHYRNAPAAKPVPSRTFSAAKLSPRPEYIPSSTRRLRIIPSPPRATVLTVSEKLDLMVKNGNVGFRCETKRGNCKECNYCVYKSFKAMEMAAQRKKANQQMYQY